MKQMWRCSLLVTRTELDAKYPKGTRVKLTAPIDDEFTPKEVGDIFVVSRADDAGQLHGHWENGGSMAIVVGVDEFEII